MIQILKETAHSLQNTVGNPDRSLFHHGLIKILVQHQLSLIGRSWDELLAENKLGLTQYWPNPPPKTRRKRRASLKYDVDDVHKVDPGISKLHEASTPLDTHIGNDVPNKIDPLDAGTNMDPSSSVKCYGASTKVDSKSMNVKKSDPVTHEFLSDLCTLKKLCDESTQKLE